MTTKRRKSYWGLAGVIALLLVAIAAAGPIMSSVEQPDYKVLKSDGGSIEIREYGAMIAAEAEVKGERQAAIREGFGLIAAYIFGKNEPNAKIAMTAPVQQQQGKQEIAMTAPVTQQAGAGVWTVRFIMPASWTMDTLPTPEDARVRLVPIPDQKMIAIRFSGMSGDRQIAKKTAELKKYVADQKLEVTGEPVFAFYNPPWTLPFLRRNEIMLELVSG